MIFPCIFKFQLATASKCRKRDGWQGGDSDCIKSCFYEILSPLCKYARHVVIIHPIAIAIAAEALISRSANSRSVGDQVLIFIKVFPQSVNKERSSIKGKLNSSSEVIRRCSLTLSGQKLILNLMVLLKTFLGISD